MREPLDGHRRKQVQVGATIKQQQQQFGDKQTQNGRKMGNGASGSSSGARRAPLTSSGLVLVVIVSIVLNQLQRGGAAATAPQSQGQIESEFQGSDTLIERPGAANERRNAQATGEF